MKRSLSLLLLFACLVLVPGVRADDPAPLTERLGGFTFAKRSDYDQPGLGYSLRYRHPEGIWADVYFYDKGLPGLEEGIQSTEARDEIEAANREILALAEAGYYANPERLGQGEKSFGPGGLSFLWTRHRFDRVREGGVTVMSETYLRVENGEFVKVRMSVPAERFSEAEPAMEAFMEALGEKLPRNRPGEAPAKPENPWKMTATPPGP